MKKKASRRLTAAFTIAAMLVTLMPSGAAFAAPAEETTTAEEAVQATQATAAAKTASKEVAGDTQEAGENQYVSYEWDYDQEQLIRTVKEIPRYAKEITVNNVTTVWSEGSIPSGTYVIKGDIAINQLLKVTGNVNLILCDGSQLQALKGVNVDQGHKFYIYGQDEISPGKLFLNTSGASGIEGNGSVDIHGGYIKAIGRTSAISVPHIRIYGGTVEASDIVEENSNVDDYISIFGGYIDCNTIQCDEFSIYGGDIYFTELNCVKLFMNGGNVNFNRVNAEIVAEYIDICGGYIEANTLQAEAIKIEGGECMANRLISSGSVLIYRGVVDIGDGITCNSFYTDEPMGGSGKGSAIIYTPSILNFNNEALDNEKDWDCIIFNCGSIGSPQFGRGMVYGDVTLQNDFRFIMEVCFVVPENATLTIPENKSIDSLGVLVNKGTIKGNGTLNFRALDNKGTIDDTVIIKDYQESVDVAVEPSATKVSKGTTLVLTAKVANYNVPEGHDNTGSITFICDGKKIGHAHIDRNGVAVSEPILINNTNEWKVGKSYTIEAVYNDRYYGSIVAYGYGTCKVSVVKPAEAVPTAPSKKAVTDTSVTLNTIAKSANGAKALYGMKGTDGSFIWQDVPYFDNLKPDTDYIFATKYEAAGDQAESPMSKEVIIRTAKSSKSDQPAPAAPVKKSVTASSVTLKTIADSSVGGKVQYGMKDATGVTKWQDSPVFENLKADTAYTFVAQYMATDKYNASAISAETVIRTEKKNSTDLLSPVIPNSTGGQTAVTVTNPKPGQAVTIITVPDKGYEVNQVKVTDENGNVIEVTKNANGQYVFNQPDTQVTIKVTYKKAATPEEPQKPEEPETPQDDWNNPFTDVPKDAWYNDAVRYVYENGLMVGLAPNNFGANVTTDRGQLVTMLWRMAGEPQATNGADFSDVPSNAYYANAVAWAAENGITSGFEDGTFRPQTGLSREQMAALFMKYAEATGVDTSVRADISSYTDIKPNSWSYDALSWAKAVGLLSGVSDTIMGPHSLATRAQIAAVLQRYCETVAK